MGELQYKFSRLTFGLIISIIAFKSMTGSSLASLSGLVKSNLKDIHKPDGIISIIDFGFLSPETNQKVRELFNFSDLEENSEDFIVFIYSLIMMGGILCLFGQPISKFFIISGLLLDLVFLHNLKFFVSDSSKGTMLKYLAFIGGALHIA